MNSSLEIPNLASGISALLFDGNTPVGRNVVLMVNLASLSQRVSLDIIDAETSAILSSNSIRDLVVLNPRYMARRTTAGEIWLGYRKAQILIKDAADRRAVITWLRLFCGASAWRGHNNSLVIVCATLAMGGLSFVASIGASIGAMSGINLASTAIWHGQAGAVALAANATTHPTRCVSDLGDTVTRDIVARLGIDPLGQPVWLSLHPSHTQAVTTRGDNSIILQPDRIAPNADQDQSLVQRQRQAQAAFGALATAIERNQNKDASINAVDRALQHSAAQVLQLKLFPSISTRLLGWLASSFNARARHREYDTNVLERLNTNGVDITALQAHFDALEANIATPGGRYDLPNWLQINDHPAIRRSNIFAQQTRGPFIPNTGNAGLTPSDVELMKLACASSE